MISVIGNTLLVGSLFFSLLGVVLRSRAKLVSFGISSSLPLFSLLLLIYAFLISDFSLKNVFFNSSTILPNIYKISACWSSHEGSILLWYSLLCFVGLAYILLVQFSHPAKEYGIMLLSFIQVLFCSFIVFTSNPFEPLSFSPKEGLGLNPMLQDIALAIHPPILYAGSVIYVSTFVGALILLKMPTEKNQILKFSSIFSALAIAFLTFGIGLGSWWAYRELGWGGYWFFDPVENISLLPWISSIALHHFLLLSIKNDEYLFWTIFLSLLCFLLTIYGTFIVRSGIISSVHSFAFSPERGIYILSICLVLTALSFVLFISSKNFISSSIEHNLKSYAIFSGNIFWLISLVCLIISLIYPIYCFLVKGIDVAIDPEYFKKIYIPLHIPILILAAISPLLSIRNYKRLLLTALVSIVLSYALSTWYIMPSIAQVFCFASIYLIISTFDYLIVRSNYFTISLSSRSYSFFFGHFGFGLLALSITLNSFLSKEAEFIGKVGEKINNNGLSIRLEDIRFTASKNYLRQIAEFSIEYPDNIITILKPENRLYKIENTLSQEVDIYSYLFYDVYAVLSKVDKGNIIHAKIYYQPFISFIWLSVVFISLGFFILAVNNTKLRRGCV